MVFFVYFRMAELEPTIDDVYRYNTSEILNLRKEITLDNEIVQVKVHDTGGMINYVLIRDSVVYFLLFLTTERKWIVL